MTRTIWLIRHAMPDIPLGERWCVGGRLDLPLGALGRLQAALLPFAPELSNVETVFCSPLRRAVETAEDDSHGYSQRVRFGPSYDCTSFVCTALMEGGFALESYVCTGGLLTELPKLGFTVYRSRETEAVRGDILIRLGKHAEICMGDGGCVAAHQDYDGRSGDSTGREIQYRKAGELYGCPFCRYRQYDYIIRYEGPAPLELPLHVPEPCVDAIS